ncbi:hypothetical protein BDZ45DRAFT_749840 [Acephala macrosclerotiorum]|nr:hypothetical protein BDZ45DRAFT_749840 [Acephala macrosclerotiorum]
MYTDAGTEESDECNEAFTTFVRRYICNLDPFPPELEASMRDSDGEGNMAATAMEGNFKWEIEGPMKGWSMIGQAKNISVPTLLINGNKEIASDAAVKPF